MTKTKWAALAAALLMVAFALLSACGRGDDEPSDNRPQVITSFYPIYYFTSEIGGDDIRLTNLIPAGVEPHDWTPKSQDLIAASKASLVLYNGAGLEGWIDDFLKGAGSGTTAIAVSDGIELIPGGEAGGEAHGHEEEGDAHGHEEEGEAHGHEDEAAADDGHDHEGGFDPHTWVSPKSALVMAGNIRDALVRVDPANEADYERRYDDLAARLTELDAKFAAELSALPHKDIVVSHRSFGYLARDYGLHQVSIMGLSPDAEPRAQDLLEIAAFVKERGVKYIFFEELISDRLARTLADEANVETLVLNPVEGLTPDQERAGDTYFTVMERNLQNLKKALQ